MTDKKPRSLRCGVFLCYRNMHFWKCVCTDANQRDAAVTICQQGAITVKGEVVQIVVVFSNELISHEYQAIAAGEVIDDIISKITVEHERIVVTAKINNVITVTRNDVVVIPHDTDITIINTGIEPAVVAGCRNGKIVHAVCVITVCVTHDVIAILQPIISDWPCLIWVKINTQETKQGIVSIDILNILCTSDITRWEFEEQITIRIMAEVKIRNK